MDPLLRGWSPTTRQRKAFFLSVGLILILNPFYVDPLGIGMPTYVYESTPVTPEATPVRLAGGDGIVQVDPRPSNGVAGVDCYLEGLPDRPCAIDAVLAGNRTITTEYRDPIRSGDRYTYVRGQFYERITTGENGRTLDVRPVTARSMLANISTSERSLTTHERRAVRRGSVRIHEPLRRGNHFVTIDGEYHLVYQVGMDDGPFAESGFQFFVSLLGVGVGSLSFARGIRSA